MGTQQQPQTQEEAEVKHEPLPIPHLYGPLRSNGSATTHSKDPGAKRDQTVPVPAVDHGRETSPLQGPSPQSQCRTVLIWWSKQLHSSANDQIVPEERGGELSSWS